MIDFAHELILIGIALVIGAISWVLKKEHARLESLGDDYSNVNERLSRAINEIAKNDVADREWRKRVEENHSALLKADEDRRGDARKIYDKISQLENETHKQIQRLAEKIAEKK